MAYQNMKDMYAKGFMEGEGNGRYQFDLNENKLPIDPEERQLFLEGYESGYEEGKVKYVNATSRINEERNTMPTRRTCSDTYMQGFYDGSAHGNSGSEKDMSKAPANGRAKQYKEGYQSGYEYGKEKRLEQADRAREL